MTKRSPIAVFFFGFLTLGFYSWYWAVKTKGELNKSGAPHIPTAWIWLIPIVGAIWWYWKYSEGAEHVTNKEVSTILAFLVLWLLGPIGQAIMQNYYNKLQPAAASASAAQDAAPAPAAPVADAPQPETPAPAPKEPTSTPPTNLVQ